MSKEELEDAENTRELRKWAVEQAIKAGYCTGEELIAAKEILRFVNKTE